MINKSYDENASLLCKLCDKNLIKIKITQKTPEYPKSERNPRYILQCKLT